MIFSNHFQEIRKWLPGRPNMALLGAFRVKEISAVLSRLEKIPHTGNTRPSRKCVIQKYRYYTMSLSQYHGCCQYHKSMSIPWVFANTMSPCLYHESMSKPWVHVCTISLIIYHESMSIPWVFFQIHAFISIPWEIQFSDIQKYK